MTVRKVMRGGRITIDKDSAKKIGIKPGDYVICRVKNGYLEIEPAIVVPRKQ
jgi:AbrB family looped-hinge helix DNA binding protein